MLAQRKLRKRNPVISIGISWNYGEKAPHADVAHDQFGHMIIVLTNSQTWLNFLLRKFHWNVANVS